MKRFWTNSLFSFAVLLCLGVRNSSASDMLWLAQGLDCDAFSQKLTAHFDGLSDPPTPQEDKITRRVVSVACGNRYAQCSFDICDLSQAAKSSKSSKKSKSFKVEPLAWLNMKLSCEGFLEQFQVRYAPLGPYSQLPKNKQEEVDRVLEIACSDRFKGCGFKSCKDKAGLAVASEEAPVKTSSRREPPTKQFSSDEAWDEAEDRFSNYLATYNAQFTKALNAQMKKEREVGAQWTKFSVEGFSAPKKKPKKVKKRIRRDRRDRWRSNRRRRN